jgi:excisionase family DNA binding protein
LVNIEGNKAMSDFFTVNDLAKYFNVNSKTIYRRLWAKGIPAYKVGEQWADCEERYQMGKGVMFQKWGSGFVLLFDN